MCVPVPRLHARVGGEWVGCADTQPTSPPQSPMPGWAVGERAPVLSTAWTKLGARRAVLHGAWLCSPCVLRCDAHHAYWTATTHHLPISFRSRPCSPLSPFCLLARPRRRRCDPHIARACLPVCVRLSQPGSSSRPFLWELCCPQGLTVVLRRRAIAKPVSEPRPAPCPLAPHPG